MTLFASILQGSRSSRPERRASQRFPINPAFPLKALLSCVSRDETGAPMSASRQAWNWKGRLLDCSYTGARLQLGPGLNAIVGEPCDLKLSVQEFTLVVPCHVGNIQDEGDTVIFGLEHDAMNDEARSDYAQLVEVLALGATLKARSGEPVADASGYLVEQYANDCPARLTIWREKSTKGIVAFEFLLQENVVQAAAGQPMEYMTGTAATGAEPATAVKAMEIHRLYTWVLPNLPAEVPADAREFLGRYA